MRFCGWQVLNWRRKVDKESGCLDRIKNFQPPPLLVAIVLEMVVNLIGKKKLHENKIDVKNFDFTSSRRHNNGSWFLGLKREQKFAVCKWNLLRAEAARAGRRGQSGQRRVEVDAADSE